jgi:hypothetical protein
MMALRTDPTQAARSVGWSLAEAIVVLSVIPPALRPVDAVAIWIGLMGGSMFRHVRGSRRDL